MGLVVTDGVSAREAAVVNQYIAGEGGLGQVFMSFHMYYDGAAWQVAIEGSLLSAATVEAALSWNGTLDELDIDISGVTRTFTVTGVPMTCPVAPSGASATAANYIAACRTSSATDIHIRFYDEVTGAQVVTEDTQMNFNIMLHGTTT